MTALANSAPSMQGLPEPTKPSAKPRRRFFDRITGGRRYRLIYWIIALVALIVFLDWALTLFNVWTLQEYGEFNISTGISRKRTVLFGIPMHTTYHTTEWKSVVDTYLPPSMVKDDWAYMSGSAISLLSGMRADGNGTRYLMATMRLMDLFSIRNFSQGAKTAVVTELVSLAQRHQPYSILYEYVAALQDGVYNAAEPITEDTVLSINKAFEDKWRDEMRAQEAREL